MHLVSIAACVVLVGMAANLVHRLSGRKGASGPVAFSRNEQGLLNILAAAVHGVIVLWLVGVLDTGTVALPIALFAYTFSHSAVSIAARHRNRVRRDNASHD